VPHKIGIIGCGVAAQALHLPALTRLSDVTVAAVSDIDPDRARQAASRFGVARAFTDYRDVLADPTITAVGVLTPPATHVEIGTAALEAGKMVLMEKPLALTLNGCDRLIEAAGTRRTAVGFNLRYHRQIAAAKRALAGIGTPLVFRSCFSGTGNLKGNRTDWRGQVGMGGDALIDLGTHHFDLLRWLFQTEFETIEAVRQGEHGAVVTARLHNGVMVSSVFSHGMAGGHTIEIYGERGRIACAPYQFDGLRIDYEGAPSGGARAVVSTLMHPLRALPRALSTSSSGGDFALAYVEEWRAFLNEGAVPSLRDGRQALAIALAAAESMEAGARVSISSAGVL